MDRKEQIIEQLSLEPLPREGGYFRFISEFGDGAGMIYYLMTESSFSHLHKLTDDEVWTFLEGDVAVQTIVSKDGTIEEYLLDSDNRTSIVPKEYFQATRIAKPEKGYSLFTTTMSPRYSDSMYTHGGDVESMLENPRLKELI